MAGAVTMPVRCGCVCAHIIGVEGQHPRGKNSDPTGLESVPRPPIRFGSKPSADAVLFSLSYRPGVVRHPPSPGGVDAFRAGAWGEGRGRGAGMGSGGRERAKKICGGRVLRKKGGAVLCTG